MTSISDAEDRFEAMCEASAERELAGAAFSDAMSTLKSRVEEAGDLLATAVLSGRYPNLDWPEELGAASIDGALELSYYRIFEALHNAVTAVKSSRIAEFELINLCDES
jgi:hypothetical protein